MKLVDLNVLLYAINTSAPHHDRLRSKWEHLLADEEPVGLAWIVVIGFLRVATNPKAYSPPLSVEDALEVVNEWIGHPNVRVVGETSEHWLVLRPMIAHTGTAGNLTTDTHLAALAISHGAVLVSCDGDFARFPKLRWENPLT
jgi:toxin-antitoxin system PIN domain toxin